MKCPTPLIKLNEGLKSLSDGTRVKLNASDPDMLKEVGAWTAATGNRLLESGGEGDRIFAIIEKGNAPANEQAASQAKNTDKTILVFSDDFDRALAAFVIANGALAMNRKVTLYFTFWGLNVLKRKDNPPVRKDLLSAMFGLMMPKGSRQLTLSKLNMLGVGTGLMRYIMKKKNVDSLEVLIKQAIASGAEVIACQMAMDVMGIKKEEFIDGVKIGGVAQFIAASEASGTTLVF